MNIFSLCKIEIFDSLVFFIYTNEGLEKRIGLSFSVNKNKQTIKINFNKENTFLQFLRFNNLLIEDFLINLINYNLVETILIEEESIPF